MLKKCLANILCLLFVVWAGLSAEPFTKELAVNLSIAPVMNIAWTDASGVSLGDAVELSASNGYEATVYASGNTNLAGQIDIIITGKKYLEATDSEGNPIGQIPISIKFYRGNKGDHTAIEDEITSVRLSPPTGLGADGIWNWTIDELITVSASQDDVNNAPTVYKSDGGATQYTGELSLIIQSV